jgi:glutathione S-transferase
LCESAVMVEYLEQQYTDASALLPKDAFAAAKVRELNLYLELHLELVARELYAEAFFGGKVSDATKEEVSKQLQKNVASFSKLVKFAPYIGGSEFSFGRLHCGCTFVRHFSRQLKPFMAPTFWRICPSKTT